LTDTSRSSARRTAPPTALVLYHYLHPDDVVSATHLTDLAVGLGERGWSVTGVAGNRGCRDERIVYPRRSQWMGIDIRRVWRPPLRQASTIGRFVNAAWLAAAWSLLSFDRRVHADVVVVGTDPILSAVVGIVWKWRRPRTQMAHWCFDLYPEAAVADGVLSERSVIVRWARALMRRAYAAMDLVVDIGACMRERISLYEPTARRETIPPWALVEPPGPPTPDPRERRELFGDAPLGLLYSGNFGRAHTWDGIPALARALDPVGHIAFSVRGNAVADLQRAMASLPVSFASFANSDQLAARLGAADVHIVTLRDTWTGTVVPSKFFGALAIGRPVLFVGSPASAIARWIEALGVGWVLTPDRVEAVAADLIALATDAPRKDALFQRCHATYRDHFARAHALDRWDEILRETVAFPR
jgi:colanic acid biosynthesis glycosyl transferase WcaI